MKKYEKDLLIGTCLTLFGIILLLVIQFNMVLSWSVMIVGKIIVILSAMEYVDYRRAVKGVDLNGDNQFRKAVRKLRRKRY